MYQYKTHGTCSQAILIDTDGETIQSVEFIGGCRGNTQGIVKLVQGMKVTEVIEKLEGIQCRAGTSCPDQLTKALKKIQEKLAAEDKPAENQE